MCFNFSRVNLESALGVIGGTMGLFTGFSVLSAVEIVYYALKYLSSLSATKIGKSLKAPLKWILAGADNGLMQFLCWQWFIANSQFSHNLLLNLCLLFIFQNHIDAGCIFD